MGIGNGLKKAQEEDACSHWVASAEIMAVESDSGGRIWSTRVPSQFCPEERGTEILRIIESIKPIAMIFMIRKHLRRFTSTRLPVNHSTFCTFEYLEFVLASGGLIVGRAT